MRKKVNVCIIGSNFGSKVHLKAIKKIKNIKIKGICGKKKRNFSKINYYRNWQKMIEETHPDFVIVAVPPNLQVKIIKFLIKKKLIFLAEKPISDNFSQIKKEEGKLKKSKGYINLNFLKIPEIIKLKEIIRSNKFSKIVNIDWHLKSNIKKNGGPILNFYFHLQSVIDYLFEKNKVISFSKTRKFKFEVKYRSSKNIINVNFDPYKKKNFFFLRVNSKFDNITLKNKTYDYHNNFVLLNNHKKINVAKKNKNKSIDSRINLINKIIKDILNNKKLFLKQISINKGMLIHKKIKKFYDY